MDRLANDTRESRLTEKSILKSDKDIATISALVNLAERTGNVLLLSGGYAVEALCGGKITRAHGDVDAHMVLTGIESMQELSVETRELLDSEETKWIQKSTEEDKIDYREDIKNDSVLEKRKVEVYFNQPNELNMGAPQKVLIDSKGKEVKVRVVPLNDLLSWKIAKLFEAQTAVKTVKDRYSSMTDYIDLKRLLSAADFDKDLVMKGIVDSLKYLNPKMTDSEAEAEAPNAYKTVLGLLAQYLGNS